MARDFLDVEAEVSEDDGEDDDDDEDSEELVGFIDDDQADIPASHKLLVPLPMLDSNKNIPVFQDIIDRYEKCQSSSSIPSSNQQSSSSSVPSSSAVHNSHPSTSSAPAPSACWDLMRDFASSGDVDVEGSMRQILGNNYDHRVWSKRYHAGAEHHDDFFTALEVVEELEAEDAAAGRLHSLVAPPTPSECWDLLRTFATSNDMSIMRVEEQMRDILGHRYDHSVWSPRYDAVLKCEDDVNNALEAVNKLQAEEVASAPPSSAAAAPSPFIDCPLPDIPAIASISATAAYNEGAFVARNTRTEQDGLDDAMNAIRVHYRDENTEWKWYHVQCMVCFYFICFYCEFLLTMYIFSVGQRKISSMPSDFREERISFKTFSRRPWLDIFICKFEVCCRPIRLSLNISEQYQAFCIPLDAISSRNTTTFRITICLDGALTPFCPMGLGCASKKAFTLMMSLYSILSFPGIW